VKTKEDNVKSIVNIIEHIEQTRIAKLSKIQEFSVGKNVKYNNKLGKVVSMSRRQTSILVEFENKSTKRFYINKRKNNENVQSLMNVIGKIECN
jgi:hypothetical protein